MKSFAEEYDKHFTSHNFTRLSLFEELKSSYGITKALYLGSYIHVTPSLVFPEVVYVDSYKKTKTLIESPDVIKYINKNKQYTETAKLTFIQQDYDKPLNIDNDFDLLISQYAGFVSQAGKKYLKKDGILVANNSHGDGSMANLDPGYKLIAVASHTKDQWRISTKDLDKYFIPKSGKADDVTTLKASNKGFVYTLTASNYIFKKI